MSESINVNKIAKHFMVLDVISSRIEDADKIIRITNMNKNNSDAKLFKVALYFRDRFLPNKRRVFMPRGLSSTHSCAFNLSVGS